MKGIRYIILPHCSNRVADVGNVGHFCTDHISYEFVAEMYESPKREAHEADD